MSNSNATHRIFVNAAINTELDPTDCVKSSADKMILMVIQEKVKLMLYLCIAKQLIYGSLYQTNTNINRQSRRKI